MFSNWEGNNIFFKADLLFRDEMYRFGLLQVFIKRKVHEGSLS